MIRIWVALILAFALQAGSGLQAKGPLVKSPRNSTVAAKKPAAPCDSAFSQAELNSCFANELKKDNAKLAATYTVFFKQLSGKDRSDLVAAQNAWLRYRAAECKVVAGRNGDGGSMQPMQYDACMSYLTQDRIKEIRSDSRDLSR